MSDRPKTRGKLRQISENCGANDRSNDLAEAVKITPRLGTRSGSTSLVDGHVSSNFCPRSIPRDFRARQHRQTVDINSISILSSPCGRTWHFTCSRSQNRPVWPMPIAPLRVQRPSGTGSAVDSDQFRRRSQQAQDPLLDLFSNIRLCGSTQPPPEKMPIRQPSHRHRHRLVLLDRSAHRHMEQKGRTPSLVKPGAVSL